MAKFTLAQFVEAMEKNGYKRTRGQYLRFKKGSHQTEVASACAAGQAFLNLGVDPKSLREDKIRTDNIPYLYTVFTSNDSHRRSVQDTAEYYRSLLEKNEVNLDQEFEIEDRYLTAAGASSE